MRSTFSSFRAVHCGGALLTGRATTALSLLFERVFLPNNVELIGRFAKSYRFKKIPENLDELAIESVSGHDDPFQDLDEQQRTTALTYLHRCHNYAVHYHELFESIHNACDTVFSTDLFDEQGPIKATLVKQGEPGQLNTYEVSVQPLLLAGGNEGRIRDLVATGYVPLTTLQEVGNSASRPAAVEVATLLAMKSVQLAFPNVVSAKPSEILEARDRLKDHLPTFWAAMLRLSTDLEALVREGCDSSQLELEANDLVDRVIRPAAIELQAKVEAERKSWFCRIFGPVQQFMRLIGGAPSITQDQLVTGALLTGADVTVQAVEHLKTLDDLRRVPALTYLLELDALARSRWLTRV